MDAVTAPPSSAPPTVATALGTLALRPRTADDAGLLLALYAASRQTELALTGWDDEQRRAFLALQLRAREQHRDATRPDADLAMVTLDDTAVGQLDLHRGDAIEVLEIALIPGLRGRGLGTALLGLVLAEADERSAPTHLHVEDGNPARRLYERLGFAAVGATGLHIAMERPVGGRPDTPRETATGTAAPDIGATPEPTTAMAAGAATDEMPTYAGLADRVGASVPCLPDGPDLVIHEVALRPRRGDGDRQPFSLLLTGPLDQELGQGLQRLRFPVTGEADLFLTPLAPTGDHALYEAIFT